MKSKSITKLNLLKIIDEYTHEAYYGCNQEWYVTERQRLTGCGPTTVCNIIWYLNHIQPAFGLNQNCSSKEKSISFMEEIWKFVTPTREGIPTTKMFYESVMAYTKTKGLDVEYRYCDLPEKKSLRPKFMDVVYFLEGALQQDSPIAFLNLCNGDEKNLEPWHWVTIIALEYSEDGKRAFIDILDEGLIKKIDLLLWYKTTTHGGGFVYFIASLFHQ
jgi:hypothetical protein